jgi:hypothetical protein
MSPQTRAIYGNWYITPLIIARFYISLLSNSKLPTSYLAPVLSTPIPGEYEKEKMIIKD